MPLGPCRRPWSNQRLADLAVQSVTVKRQGTNDTYGTYWTALEVGVPRGHAMQALVGAAQVTATRLNSKAVCAGMAEAQQQKHHALGPTSGSSVPGGRNEGLGRQAGAETSAVTHCHTVSVCSTQLLLKADLSLYAASAASSDS